MLIRTRLKCKFRTQMLMKLWVEAGRAFCLHLNPGKYKTHVQEEKKKQQQQQQHQSF